MTIGAGILAVGPSLEQHTTTYLSSIDTGYPGKYSRKAPGEQKCFEKAPRKVLSNWCLSSQRGFGQQDGWNISRDANK